MLGNTGLRVSFPGFGSSLHEISEAEGGRVVQVAVGRSVNLIDVSHFDGLANAETGFIQMMIEV